MGIVAERLPREPCVSPDLGPLTFFSALEIRPPLDCQIQPLLLLPAAHEITKDPGNGTDASICQHRHKMNIDILCPIAAKVQLCPSVVNLEVNLVGYLDIYMLSPPVDWALLEGRDPTVPGTWMSYQEGILEVLQKLGQFLLSFLLALLVIVVGTYLLQKWAAKAQARAKIEDAQKRREVALKKMEAAIERLKQQAPKVDPEYVLSLSLRQLAHQLRQGSLSPESVLCIYMEKALKVHYELNCLTDYLEDCEAQLQELKKQPKEKRGLLYGVPVSLKDPYDYKGHDSTCGMAYFLGKPAEEDATIVKVLKSQGAVPFVKTNIPQTLLSIECSNPIFGETLHPQNPKKTPGGSTGGEGALLASGGSIIGFGTDTGGSIRIPSSFCGIYGIKPTGFRLSYNGINSAIKGKKSVITMAGPLAQDVDSLVLVFRLLVSEYMFQLDPTVPPMPFREEVYSSTQPLRIGYVETDGFTQPSPSMVRAVREVSKKLQAAGHQIIPFSIIRPEYMMIKLYMGGLYADGGETLLEKLRGDIIDPTMSSMISILRLPDFIKWLVSWVLRPVDTWTAKNFAALRGVGTPKNLWEQHVAVEEYQKEIMSNWRAQNLDVLLYPALGPAFDRGTTSKALDAASYMALFNSLNFPVGVVPVGTVTAQDEEELASYHGYYGDSRDKNFKKAIAGSLGLPIAVQCVALPWREELCLRFMKEVETLVHGKTEIE
ncbi:vitamin D3 hydroxylase-associated protein-like [Trichosurus vulpecula]|uniref:vitamin D3 hydroxylase-associated protein-like n=1 Tax=Trichosurus vulpecula TaxID=9337 RepID=UPI00186AC07F|nr:vitamin D3 hydroxylase-associated protein-like [Trichosurus vulpecula]